MSKIKHMWQRVKSVNIGNKNSWHAILNSCFIYKVFTTIIPNDPIKFMHRYNICTILQSVLKCIRREPIQNMTPGALVSKYPTEERNVICIVLLGKTLWRPELYSNRHTWGLSTASFSKKNEYLSDKIFLQLLLILFLGLFCFLNYPHTNSYCFFVFIVV